MSRGARTRIALRAAQVACGLTLAACGSPSGPTDAGLDAATQSDAPVDADVPHDANCTDYIPTNQYCCELEEGEWWEYEDGFAECFIAVPGPFVPPAERPASVEGSRAAPRGEGRG